MTAPHTFSPASPPPLPLAQTPAIPASAGPARGSDQPFAPLSAGTAPAFSDQSTFLDARKLQGAWDEEGAALVVRRYRIVPDRQVEPPAALNWRGDALLLPPLCALLVITGTLIVAMVRGGLL